MSDSLYDSFRSLGHSLRGLSILSEDSRSPALMRACPLTAARFEQAPALKAYASLTLLRMLLGVPSTVRGFVLSSDSIMPTGVRAHLLFPLNGETSAAFKTVPYPWRPMFCFGGHNGDSSSCSSSF